VGRYVLGEELGAGAMGVVHAAFDPELGRRVALKLVRTSPDDPAEATRAERLVREARAMARLTHPNVVTVHDVGRAGDHVFIAMELVVGQTLTRWLAERRRSWREILAVFVDAGRGLAAAHQAGVLHRDFKPDNVLVGGDGRVRVGDFGLAHALPEASAVAASTPSSPDEFAPIQATGGLSGTPCYMAPEQFARGPIDARSDQFSFCVALWQALYRELPFAGETLESLASAVLLGERRAAPATPRLPAGVRRALVRGLSRDPEDRFPAMIDLLHALGGGARRRGVHLVAGALVAAGAVAAVLATAGGRDEAALCSGAASRFAEVWGPVQREAIREAFAATSVPYGAGAASRVAAVLDGHRDRWIAMDTRSCRATRVTGEQPEDVQRLRMICLERRRKEVRALVDVLAAADPAAVESSVAAALRLPPVEACGDIDALTAVLPPPADPAAVSEMEEIETRLAAARAHQEAGRYASGLDLARAAAAEATELGYRPLEAEALLAQGRLEHRAGEPKLAEKTLERAVRAAEAGRHDRVAAMAWAELTFLVGYELARYARGVELGDHAAAALERLGGDDEIQSTLEKALGAIEADQGRLDPALAHFERAVTLLERAHGPDHPGVTSALDNVGMAALASGDVGRALIHHRRGLEIHRRVLGPDHPAVARSLHNLANAEAARGDHAVAEGHLREALALREPLLGREHADVAATLTDLGRVVRAQGRLAEALELDRRALAAGEKAFGADHPTFAQQLINTGLLLRRMKRHDEAFDHHRRARAILTRALGADHPESAYCSVAMADARLDGGRPREALALYERAVPLLDAALEDANPQLGDGLFGMGRALAAVGQPARAVPFLERAVRASDAAAPEFRAERRFALARALWDARRDRSRAIELAREARRLLESSGAGQEDSLRDIDAWLVARARPVR
jgi:tetratricopeptide (TPR) repeat protein